MGQYKEGYSGGKTIEKLVSELISDPSDKRTLEIVAQIEELERQIPLKGKSRFSEDYQGEMSDWISWNTLITLSGYPFELRGQCRKAHLATTLGRLLISLKDLGAEADIEGGKAAK